MGEREMTTQEILEKEYFQFLKQYLPSYCSDAIVQGLSTTDTGQVLTRVTLEFVHQKVVEVHHNQGSMNE